MTNERTRKEQRKHTQTYSGDKGDMCTQTYSEDKGDMYILYIHIYVRKLINRGPRGQRE